jgi:hypothetical protein
MTFQYAVIPDTCRVTDPACTADIEVRNIVDPVGSFASWVDDGYRPERYIDMEVSPLSDDPSCVPGVQPNLYCRPL